MRFGMVVSTIVFLKAITVLATSDEMIFLAEIEAQNADERSQIAEVIHLDSVSDDRVFSIVNQHDLDALKKNNAKIISVEALTEARELDAYYAPFVGSLDFPEDDAAFHNFDEAYGALKALEAAHPGVAQVFSVGKSVENRDIWGLRISIDHDLGANKKAIVYMGTHHAREHVSTEIPILFAEEILGRVHTDAAITELLSTIEIYIIPIVNPDGAIHDISGRGYKWWRKNRRQNRDGTFGVDLNRNYGFGWGTGGSSSTPSSDIYKGTAPFSEPETQAIRDFFLAHRNVTIALSFHTFSELILYPWGGRHTGVGGNDELLFKKMAGEMAAMNHYEPMQSSKLYIASGDTCDWLYGELKVYCFTFELSPSDMFGGGFYPGAGIINTVYDANLEPMLYLAHLTDRPARALER
jgi:carboxypeptidase T